MPARILVTIGVALATGVPLQALSASFNIRPGAWEMTMTTAIAGNPIPPEALADMPPEKRAKVEESMKARAAKPIAIKHKTCVTQDRLDQDRIVQAIPDDSTCTRRILAKSPTKLVIEQDCPAPRALTAKMAIEATTPENLTASIDIVRGEEKGKVHVDIAGRWIGASCEGIKGGDD